MNNDEIRREILRVVRQRGPGSSACPSRVARNLRQENWRELMDDVREVASQLQQAGEITITQSGEPVTLDSASGPVRLTLPDEEDSQSKP